MARPCAVLCRSSLGSSDYDRDFGTLTALSEHTNPNPCPTKFQCQGYLTPETTFLAAGAQGLGFSISCRALVPTPSLQLPITESAVCPWGSRQIDLFSADTQWETICLLQIVWAVGLFLIEDPAISICSRQLSVGNYLVSYRRLCYSIYSSYKAVQNILVPMVDGEKSACFQLSSMVNHILLSQWSGSARRQPVHQCY